MKEIMNELSIFMSEFRDNQYVTDEIQISIYLIKDEIESSIEKLIPKNKNRDKLFWLDSDGKKLTTNPLEK